MRGRVEGLNIAHSCCLILLSGDQISIECSELELTALCLNKRSYQNNTGKKKGAFLLVHLLSLRKV